MNVSGLAPPLTEQAEDIDRIWDLFLLAGLVVGVGVLAVLLFVLIRFRRRDTTLPRQRREHIPIEVTYTVVPLLIVAGLFGITFVSVNAIDEVADDPDLTVEVIGFQWQWQFDYPASGITVTGTEDELPELVLPTGTTVQFDLTSVDVIHSFWIPGFRFKRDVFPGQTQSSRSTSARRPETGRTAASAPSSAASTTTRCGSRSASSHPTSSPPGSRSGPRRPTRDHARPPARPWAARPRRRRPHRHRPVRRPAAG